MIFKSILLIFVIALATTCGVKTQILDENSIKIPKNCKHFYISKISICAKDSKGIWHCMKSGQKICDKYYE